MSDAPSHEELLARIEALELAVEEKKARHAARAETRAQLEIRRSGLRSRVASLEKRAARPRRRRLVKNGVAAALAIVGALAFGGGVFLEGRLLATDASWVETTCTVVRYEDEGARASPALRPSATFPAPDGARAATTFTCFVPDSLRGDGIGRASKPPTVALRAIDKLRTPYLVLAIEGLAATVFLVWIALQKPAKDA